YSPEAPDITVRTYNSKNNVIISVTDKGLGMTKDQQEKIFDQFYRIPTGNIHNVKGFGLGLSYVSDIVKRLDGKIQVKSEKDKGTSLEVIIALKNKQNFNLAIMQKILLAEDDANIGDLLKDYLELKGK